MYERHFGFTEKPFNLTPDSRYLFLSPKHQEAFANLSFGVAERSGFLLLTGEIGTGKTTLIRHFLSQVGPDVRTAVVLYPALSAGEMFHAILQDLEVPFAGGSLKDAVDTLANALIEAKAMGLKVVVFIDEAQSLKPHVLEQLRLLSNLETEREKLLTLVLVGQPELRGILDQPSLRQLSQRMTSRSHLEPLSLDDTIHYVKHRLVVAGGKGREISEEAAVRVHELSGGVPRVVNLLCDRALVGAFGRGLKQVDAGLVDLAAREVLPAATVPRLRVRRGVLEGLALFAVGLFFVWALWYILGPDPKPQPSVAAPLPVATATPVSFPSPIPSSDPSATQTAAAASSSPGLASPAPSPTASVRAVRCGSVVESRSAAIAAIEEFLGTPGFDSAQATLTFDQWRELNLPAIAPFRSAMGACEAAVLPGGERLTRVADASGGYEMENLRLKEAYIGTAIICFVDRDNVLAKPELARVEWARRILERKGLIPRRASDARLAEALTTVGEKVGLKKATSVEGPLLAALYSLDGSAVRRPGAPR